MSAQTGKNGRLARLVIKRSIGRLVAKSAKSDKAVDMEETMSYVNVGAYVDGKRPKSKAALKRALAPDSGANVRFDSTGMAGARAGDSIAATPEDVGTDKLSVVGPDPYTTRNWYGTVEVRNGRLTLS